MKSQKLCRPRVPWWTWDYGYDLPPNKGENKVIGNRRARRRGKREIEKVLKEGYGN